MKIAPKNRVQRALVVGAGVLALLGTAGCSAVNEQATTREYAASDGLVASVGPVNLRNLLVVSEDPQSSGRILGTAINTSDSPVQLNLTAASSTASVTVPANGQIRFEDKANATTLNALGAAPGALVPMTLRVNSDSSELQVPVLNDSLVEYGPYLESPKPTSTAAPTGEATPSGEATAAPEATTHTP
ncbi:hypothetical protein LVY72_13705 [Arthrobacter sp. I2-34]|uniref:DNA modification methylase n=1 Tax=Arthrobacter hankyongi TaxID=2904801 RepID=A0ABS9L8F6_9MICC|nr:hypothetical protein [Arthrobacter hankyongi]MCG2622952.1 hypothetical protein [Arthrobacter hankyongi]